MINDPTPGFTDSFSNRIQSPSVRVFIKSHDYLTKDYYDDVIVANASTHVKQKFTTPDDIHITKIEFLISRNSMFSESILIKIYKTDTNGNNPQLYNGFSKPIYDLNNKKNEWYSIETDTPFLLEAVTGNQFYWISLECQGDTEVSLFSGTLQNSSIMVGSSILQDKCVCMKLSKSESNNMYEITSVMSGSIGITNMFDSDTASFTISKLSWKYKDGSPLRSIFEVGKEVTMRVFMGDYYIDKGTFIIDSVSDSKKNTLTFNLSGKQTVLVNQDAVFKEYFIGIDYSLVVTDLLIQSKMYTNVNIPLTGILFPQQGTLSGKIIDCINKICNAIGYKFYIDEQGEPVFTQNTINLVPVFTLREDTNIFLNGVSSSFTINDSFNRCLINNGMTSDGEEIKTSEVAVKVDSKIGYIEQDVVQKDIISFYPSNVLYASIQNNTPDNVYIEELSRNTRYMLLKILNKKYPASVSYDIDFFGNVIENDFEELIVEERVNSQFLKKTNLVSDYTETNNLISTKKQAYVYADRLLFYNSYSKEELTVNGLCIPTLQNNDIIKMVHQDINQNFLFKIKSQNISFMNESGDLNCVYTLERLQILDGGGDLSKFIYWDGEKDFNGEILFGENLSNYNKTYS
jgi:hypothetical protein